MLYIFLTVFTVKKNDFQIFLPFMHLRILMYCNVLFCIGCIITFVTRIVLLDYIIITLEITISCMMVLYIFLAVFTVKKNYFQILLPFMHLRILMYSNELFFIGCIITFVTRIVLFDYIIITLQNTIYIFLAVSTFTI